MKKFNALLVLLVVSTFAMAGCEQKKVSVEEMMTPPMRPVELDRLDAFVGAWRGECEMVMAGSDETTMSEGESVVEWGIDNRFMVEHYRYSAGGKEMEGVAYWTWDNQLGKFRTWWFEGDGSAGVGTVEYDEDDRAWELEGISKNLFNGEKYVAEGSIEFVDADTIKWDFEAWDSLHLTKFMEIHGTNRRQ